MTTGPFATLPATFGRYRVEKLLGRGAMGAVFLARDTQLNRLVALKIPKVAASGSKRLLLRLETEAKAAAQLDHPCLCKVHDAGEIDGQCFIAMQYIEGETLKSQLEAQGKSVADAVALILQLAEGLAEAHELGIVHRDLKPENIMINRRGTPVIMDFGLAKFSTMTGSAVATQAGTILGSPAYMSPEQASGNVQEIDQRSDIYSLGIILFELLTGKWPFAGSAMQILGQKSLLDPASPLSLNPELPQELAVVCHKMIARTNEDRYQDLHEVIHDLTAIDFNSAVVDSMSPAVQPTPTLNGFHDFAEPQPADERAASVAKRLPQQPTPVVLRFKVALAERLHRFQTWWTGRTPLVKWTAVTAGVVILLGLGLGILQFFPARPSLVETEKPAGAKDLAAISPEPPSPKGADDAPPVSFDPIPLNSNWKGTVRAEHPNGVTTAVPATATVTQRGTDDFTIRITGVNVRGSFNWEYDCTRHDQDYQIAKATLSNSNWEEQDGEIPIATSTVSVRDTELAIKLSRPLPDGVRKQTFNLEREPNELNQQAWDIVVQPTLTASEYSTGLYAAGLAARMKPGDPAVLNTLGVAQYRAGKFQKAIESLARSETLYGAREPKHSEPSNLAFAALAKFRLGDTAGAQTALDLVREQRLSLDLNISTVDAEFCEEAEFLIDPPSSSANRSIQTNAGNWTIDQNTLVQSDAETPSLVAVFGDPTWTDYDYSFHVVKTDGLGGVAAVYRAGDLRNTMIFDISGGNNDHYTSMCFIDGGRRWWRSGDPHHMETGQTYKYLIRARGSRIDCYVDGSLRMSVEDSPETCVLGQGAVGVRCWGAAARISDIKVLAPNGKILWMGLPQM